MSELVRMNTETDVSPLLKILLKLLNDSFKNI